MLRYAAIFAGAAAIAGFGGVAGAATELALIPCFMFALVAVVTFILGLLKQQAGERTRVAEIDITKT